MSEEMFGHLCYAIGIILIGILGVLCYIFNRRDRGGFTDEDLRIFEELKAAGVFEAIDAEKLASMADGTVACLCSDGRWTGNTLKMLHMVQREHGRKDPFTHLVCLHGGPLRLRVASQANQTRYGNAAETCENELVLAGEIAMKLSGNRTMTLVAHSPCGMAALSGMSFLDTVREVVAVKHFIRESHPCLFEKIVCIMHRVGRNGTEVFSFINVKRFDEWQAAAEQESREKAA